MCIHNNTVTNCRIERNYEQQDLANPVDTFLQYILHCSEPPLHHVHFDTLVWVYYGVVRHHREGIQTLFVPKFGVVKEQGFSSGSKKAK